MSYSEKTQLAAYQNNINLELFSIVLYLAAVTSEDEEAMEKYRISKNKYYLVKITEPWIQVCWKKEGCGISEKF